MENYHLSDRGLLVITGDDAGEFLQSVITNDINLLNEQPAIYAAHLTPKGKFLFDFFIFKKNNSFFIDCNKKELMPLAKALHSYVITKKVEFNDFSDDYKCIASEFNINNSFISFLDPRCKGLGYRIWLKSLPNDIKTLNEYTKKRIDNCIIDGAYDSIKQKTLINELDFESLNGVSFNKGCYVGQELTARTKFRTKSKKRICKILISEPVECKTVIKYKNMDAGWVFSNYNNVGIALIRTRYLDKKLTINNKQISLI